MKRASDNLRVSKKNKDKIKISLKMKENNLKH